MEYLKYFESQSDITFREKVESIVRLFNYLWDHKEIKDGSNFIGECSIIFVGCVSFNHGWKRGGVRMMNIDIDRFLKRIDDPYRRDEGIASVEKAYKFSKWLDKGITPEYVEKILQPLINLRLFGGKAFTSYEIDWFWASFLKKTRFAIKFKLDEDLFEMDEKDVPHRGDLGHSIWRDSDNIDNYKKEMIKRIGHDFYRYRKMIETEIKDLDLSKYGFTYEVYDGTSHNMYYDITLLLTIKE